MNNIFIITSGSYSNYKILGTVSGPPLTNEQLLAYGREWVASLDDDYSSDEEEFIPWLVKDTLAMRLSKSKKFTGGTTLLRRMTNEQL